MDCQDVNDDENGLTCLHVLLSHSFLTGVGQIVYQCITIDRQHYFQWPASNTWNNIFTPDLVPDIDSVCT